MARGVSFEYQRKFDDPRWRSAWRWALTIGSALIPLLLGVALGDLLHGLPINSSHQFTGNFFDPSMRGADPGALPPHGRHLPHVEDGRRAPRAGAEGLGRHRGRGHSGHVRFHDLDPRGPEHGLRPQADERPSASWPSSPPPGPPRRWAFTAAAIGMAGAVGVSSASSTPGSMISSSTNSAYNLTIANWAEPLLHAEGDDGDHGYFPPPRVPVLGLPHLQRSAWRCRESVVTRARSRRLRRGPVRPPRPRRRSLSVEDQRPGLLCMIPPSAKIVVAVR